MSDLSNTQFFQVEPGPQISARDILEIVFKALKEKGYDLPKDIYTVEEAVKALYTLLKGEKQLWLEILQ